MLSMALHTILNGIVCMVIIMHFHLVSRTIISQEVAIRITIGTIRDWTSNIALMTSVTSSSAFTVKKYSKNFDRKYNDDSVWIIVSDVFDHMTTKKFNLSLYKKLENL